MEWRRYDINKLRRRIWLGIMVGLIFMGLAEGFGQWLGH